MAGQPNDLANNDPARDLSDTVEATMASVDMPQTLEATPEVASEPAPPIPMLPTPPDGWRGEWLPLGERSEDERARILAAAQCGDEDALHCVLWSMAVEPDRGAKFVDLPRQMRSNLVDAASDPRNGLTHITIETECEMVRASLLAACSGTAIESLLVERIVICWLAAYLADGTAAMASRYAGRDGVFYLQRQDRAHKRLLQSVEALTRVQRLMQPGPLVAQVNIAQAGAQQLNMATRAEPAPVVITHSSTWPPVRGSSQRTPPDGTATTGWTGASGLAQRELADSSSFSG